MISNETSYGKSYDESDDPSLSWRTPANGLEDRIRRLCAEVVEAQEDELQPAISELKAALREHSNRLRRLATAKLTRFWFTPEQSSSSFIDSEEG